MHWYRLLCRHDRGGPEPGLLAPRCTSLRMDIAAGHLGRFGPFLPITRGIVAMMLNRDRHSIRTPAGSLPNGSFHRSCSLRNPPLASIMLLGVVSPPPTTKPGRANNGDCGTKLIGGTLVFHEIPSPIPADAVRLADLSAWDRVRCIARRLARRRRGAGPWRRLRPATSLDRRSFS